jgi:hypothetical protein
LRRRANASAAIVAPIVSTSLVAPPSRVDARAQPPPELVSSEDGCGVVHLSDVSHWLPGAQSAEVMQLFAQIPFLQRYGVHAWCVPSEEIDSSESEEHVAVFGAHVEDWHE